MNRMKFLFIFATLFDYSAASCGGNGKYIWDGSYETTVPTNTTEFQQNLEFVLSQLPTDQKTFNWVGAYKGTGPNAAYAQARCIGDIDYYTCCTCIKKASIVLKNDCSREALSALLWYGDKCMVQYSNHNMLGVLQMHDDMILIRNGTGNVKPVSVIDAFNEARKKLFNALSSKMSSQPNGKMMFATGIQNERSSKETIYGAAQCSANLNSEQCKTCLDKVGQKLGMYFHGKVGGNIVSPNCNFQYEVYDFLSHPADQLNFFSLEDYLSSPLPSPSPPPPEDSPPTESPPDSPPLEDSPPIESPPDSTPQEDSPPTESPPDSPPLEDSPPIESPPDSTPQEDSPPTESPPDSPPPEDSSPDITPAQISAPESPHVSAPESSHVLPLTTPPDLPPASPHGLSSPPKGKGSNKALLAIYIAVPLVIIFMLFVCIYVLLRKRKHKKPTTELETSPPSHSLFRHWFEWLRDIGKDNDGDSSGPDITTEQTLQYDLASITAATENFSEAYKLGEGGFGIVYKGKLKNGNEIAVKRLSQSSKQGKIEFANEVTLLAKLQHKNLVRLLGYCLKGKERILIYEFMANLSLDNYIFDPIKRAYLNWVRLYKIIGSVARGLLYLHEDSRLRIIHRDLKSSNILLDNEMTPKIADFGMARLFISDETHGITRKIAGTRGYMAPEYLMYGQFSFKSDVFSFGVLILEIIFGHRNDSFRIGKSVENLLSYCWKCWQEGNISDLIDPVLRSEIGSTPEIKRCIHIGLLCAQEDAARRPNMVFVNNWLSNPSLDLPIPSKPYFHQCSINLEALSLPEYTPGTSGNSIVSKYKSSSSWTSDTEPRL